MHRKVPAWFGPEAVGKGTAHSGNLANGLPVSAPRGALSYPRFSREKLGGMFLGLMAHLDLKSEGNRSMSGKYRLRSGV